MWADDQLRLLITERRNRNVEYYEIPGSSRVDFWNNIADIINRRFSTNYMGYQCKGKFQNLVRDHTGIEPEPEYDTLRNSAHVFERDRFDQIHNINAFSRRREERRRNHTPPPTYEEVSSMINMSRRESPTSQRDRSASPTWRNLTRRDETTNQDNVSNVNDADRNSGHNTNDVARNLDNAIYSSLTNLANTTSTPNISASQNDSDISMADVGGSQPLEPINEVES
ncbi:5810_t:CDS:2 [Cetraspora pellucida]|uniref:5810_t:CDS:1 n=1 Tax=Cetraspora pellucida TaxID=1433469 RepID=A0A9N9K379_9GLOM|nr:5810_t:CDS:2 [Cetraspora pellucida]